MNKLDLENFSPTSDHLKDRIVVITGAGDGIGKTIAMSCAAHGATVVLLGRTLGKLEAVYDEIEKAGGPQPAIFPINFDSATEQDYTQLHTALNQEFGRVDGILHNAAELGALSPIESYKVQEWEKMIRVNLTAPFVTTKALLPLTRLSADGRILFTTSTAAIKGQAFWGAYSASKGGIDNLMQTLADELEETRIRVNAINPGPIRTNLRAKAMPAEDPSALLTPADIIKPYLYLLGPDSVNMHGQIVQAQ